MKKQKLALNKETIRGLQPDVLVEIVGGSIVFSAVRNCRVNPTAGCRIGPASQIALCGNTTSIIFTTGEEGP